MEDKREKVVQALGDWVIRTVRKDELATPKEIEVLPEVAKAFLENCQPAMGFATGGIVTGWAEAESLEPRELFKGLPTESAKEAVPEYILPYRGYKEVVAAKVGRRMEPSDLADEVSIALFNLRPTEEEFDQLIKRIKSNMYITVI